MAKEKIQQRMEAEHLFQFQCYPGVSCFTQCCRDVTIVLTPYDVLRLKNCLKMSSPKQEKNTWKLWKDSQDMGWMSEFAGESDEANRLFH